MFLSQQSILKDFTFIKNEFVMMTRITLFHFYVFFLVAVFSCKNDNETPLQEFKLTITQENNLLEHTWTETNLAGFEEYLIVRSSEPIPVSLDPFSSTNIPSEINIIIHRESDQKKSSWQEVVLSETTKYYYRVFIKLNDRFIASNEVEVSLEENFVFRSTANSDVEVFHHPELKLVYLADLDSLFAYSYETRQVVASTQLPVDFYKGLYAYGKHNGQDEIYLVPQGFTDDEIIVLNAVNLDYIETIGTGFGSIEALNTEREGVIVIVKDSSSPIRVLNRENGNTLGSGSCDCANIYHQKIDFSSTTENTLRLIFSSGVGEGGYRDFTFSDTWNFLSVTPIENFLSSPLQDIAYSRDKNYFIPNRNGSLFDKGGDIINSIYDPFDDEGASVSFVFLDDESTFFGIDDLTLFGSVEFSRTLRRYSYPDVELLEKWELETSLGLPDKYQLFYDGDRIILSYSLGFAGNSKVMIVPIDL